MRFLSPWAVFLLFLIASNTSLRAMIDSSEDEQEVRKTQHSLNQFFQKKQKLGSISYLDQTESSEDENEETALKKSKKKKADGKTTDTSKAKKPKQPNVAISDFDNFDQTESSEDENEETVLKKSKKRKADGKTTDTSKAKKPKQHNVAISNFDNFDQTQSSEGENEKKAPKKPNEKKKEDEAPDTSEAKKSKQFNLLNFFTKKAKPLPPKITSSSVTSTASSSLTSELQPMTNSGQISNSNSSSYGQDETMKVEDETAQKRKAIREEAEKGIKNSQLNIYLLKKHEELPPPSEISEDKQKEFEGFPWQFLSENKYNLIGASHDQEYFIDGQIYTQIKNGEGEKIYVFQETGIRQTEWTKIIYQQAKKHKSYEETRNPLYESAQYKEPKGAIIFVKRKIGDGERFFALTFGMTGRYLLNLDYCDPAFGKHYAYNILSSNPNYKAQAYTEINLDEKKLKREQAKLNGKVEALRGVRAFVPKALTVTDGKKQVCSFLGTHICINNKFAFETIGELCHDLLKIAEKEDYKEKYEHIDHFRPLEKQEEIDEILLKGLKNYYIEAPFEVDGNLGSQGVEKLELKSNLSFKKHFSLLQQSYEDFSVFINDLKKYIQSNRNNEILKKLRSLKITAKNDSNHPISHWRADQLITATVNHSSKTYWIEGGEIFEVDGSFIEWINKRLDSLFWARKKFNKVDNVLPENSSLRLLTSFTDSDIDHKYGKPRLSENAYNKRIADTYSKDFLLYDSKNIRVVDDPNPHSTVEPCDLLSKEGDLIHLKRWANGSENLSHLSLQGLSSASLLIENTKFQDEFFKNFPKNENFAKAYELLKENKLRVVLVFIHKKNEITPSGLPFNAKMALFRGMLDLEKLGLKSIIISVKDDTTKKEKDDKMKKKPKKKKTFLDLDSSSEDINSSEGFSLSQNLPQPTSSSFHQNSEKDKEQRPTQQGSSHLSTPNETLDNSSSTNSPPPEIDTLTKDNYKNLKILLRANIEGLSIRNKPNNSVGEPKEAYLIDNKKFRLQNVSGESMRCFFNAAGLKANTEIENLKRKQNDPVVRYMIANEIVSAAANPNQLPEQVKDAIDYKLYKEQREQLDELEKTRSEELVAQTSEGKSQNPQALPIYLQSTREEGENILEDLRKRACSLNAFNTFLDYHIGSEKMMVALHDVQGEAKDNKNANYTSIDAIAYINNLGMRIYQPNEKELRLAHQFIPLGATEIVYLYHRGAHFQALVPE